MLRFLIRRWLRLAAACALAAPASAQTAAAPRRVVSANLCADQLLVTLADPDQIAALSPFAADPAQSYVAAEAARFPRSRGTAEDIVARRADLVLTGPFDDPATKDLLTVSRIPFEAIDNWRSFADGFAQIRELAARLGHPERGRALIERIKAALDRAERAARAAREPPATAVVLGHDGYVFEGGIVWAILNELGLRDDGPRLGLRQSGFASLESLVAARPDYLVLSGSKPRARDEGSAFLVHPALQSLFPPRRTLVAPERLAQCDGPSTPDLIDVLSAEVAATRRSNRAADAKERSQSAR